MEYVRFLSFVLLVILGVAFSYRGIGYPLIQFGLEGIKVEQQMHKEEQNFQHALQLRDQAEQHRKNEHDRQMEILRLQRLATPEEGY